ncbi:caspase family protein [Hydrogenophaga sp.]|uniref:caspase family protein n=1 Tax=Hydrogenophaga sp. TaxID=1904254 RepID=UPI0025BB8919|nr:caspase family protein [Hydrogenophaga sp.]
MATQPRPVKPRQAQGMSLHIGINKVQASAYAGWTGPLAACEFDANDLTAVARSQGLVPQLLLTQQATRSKVLAALRAAARRLVAGDLFFLSYSGHGGQVPDVSGEEPDKLDETWCLYDGQLIDDELYLLLSRFRSGVRVLVLSDSCHSGTVVRAGREPGAGASARPRIMPPAVGMRVYQAHQAFYDRLQEEATRAAGGAVIDPDVALAQVAVNPRLGAIVKDFQPAVLLISGCQDNQFSMDGDHNGAFTEQVLRVWNHGSFQGNYALFHAKVRAALPPSQSPNLFTLGPAATLLKQTPFTL